MAKKKRGHYAGMISEDRSKQSNLPTEVMMVNYPMRDSISTDVPDDMYAMDGQVNMDIRGARAQMAKRKY